MKRLALYIDGFNFYHAVNDLNRPHLKWVDLFKLAQILSRPSEEVVAVKYFSAFATWRPDSYARHRRYVQALKARGVEIIMAHFKEKAVKCNKCGKEWTSREEKETDVVHLAFYLLADSEDNLFDRGMLLTVDSGLVPVVKMVKSRHPKKEITVAAPPKRYRQGRHLKQLTDSYFEARPNKLAQALLPEVIDRTDSEAVRRPLEYAPPQREQ